MSAKRSSEEREREIYRVLGEAQRLMDAPEGDGNQEVVFERLLEVHQLVHKLSEESDNPEEVILDMTGSIFTCGPQVAYFYATTLSYELRRWERAGEEDEPGGEEKQT